MFAYAVVLDETRGLTLAQLAVDPTPLPDELVHHQQQAQRLTCALRRLPQRQHRVMLLLLSGETPPAVARKLGLNTVAVWSATASATATLRLALGN